MIENSNDLRTVFDGKSRFVHYTLIRVPNGTDFSIEYDKPGFGLGISLNPRDLFSWHIQGFVDSDIIEHLRYPVAEKRRGAIPPVLSEDTLESIKQGGGEIFDEGNGLYFLSADITYKRAEDFLNRIWQPDRSLLANDKFIPKVVLFRPDWNFRILPEKNTLRPDMERDSRLAIVFYDTTSPD